MIPTTPISCSSKVSNIEITIPHNISNEFLFFIFFKNQAIIHTATAGLSTFALRKNKKEDATNCGTYKKQAPNRKLSAFPKDGNKNLIIPEHPDTRNKEAKIERGHLAPKFVILLNKIQSLMSVYCTAKAKIRGRYAPPLVCSFNYPHVKNFGNKILNPNTISC